MNAQWLSGMDPLGLNDYGSDIVLGGRVRDPHLFGPRIERVFPWVYEITFQKIVQPVGSPLVALHGSAYHDGLKGRRIMK